MREDMVYPDQTDATSKHDTVYWVNVSCLLGIAVSAYPGGGGVLKLEIVDSSYPL